MLNKSKRSAVLMACIFGIPVVLIALVVGEVRYLLSAADPNVVNGFAGVVPALFAVAVVLLSLGIMALIIYHLDESHYGREGAIRWGITGTIYGLSQQVMLTPIPSDFDFAVTSMLKQIGGDLLWKVLALVLSYLLVFPLFAFAQNRLRRSRGE